MKLRSLGRATAIVGVFVLVATLASGAGAAQRYVALVLASNVTQDARALRTSVDGQRLYFDTSQSLDAADTDSLVDIYEHFNGQDSLVTQGSVTGSGLCPGPGPGSSPCQQQLLAVSPSGLRVYFATREQLVSADGDSFFWDIYERYNGVTTLVSVEPSGEPQFTNSSGIAASNLLSIQKVLDSGRVYFTYTNQNLQATTMYERYAGVTTRFPGGGFREAHGLCGETGDGSTVIFQTKQNLLPEDTDPQAPPGNQGPPEHYEDVYQRSDGVLTLLSEGPAQPATHAATDAFCFATSDDTSVVVFATREALVAGDTDSEQDVYERSGGTTTLLSVGPGTGNAASNASPLALSSDGSTFFFNTDEPLLPADQDSSVDIYETSGGALTLVSTGPVGGNGPYHAGFAGMAGNGARLYFLTDEALVADDTDGQTDFYERSGTQTLLVAGGNGTCCPSINVPPLGTGVFVTTPESLVPGDTDSQLDVYEWAGGNTRLVSTGPAGGNGAFDAQLAGFPAFTPDGGKVFLQTYEGLVAEDTDGALDIYAALPVADEGATQPVGPGGTVSTGGTPTPEDPVETAVTSPNAANVTINEGDVTTSAPSGYELLGMQVDIAVTPGGTASSPITLVFRLDGSLLGPAGVDHTSVQILRNGVPVDECDATTPSIDPNPCVSQRAALAGGGAELTVLTSNASAWNFARATAPADSTPPTITPSISGSLGSQGWYVSDVDVSWTVQDPDSPVTSTTGCATAHVTVDTAGTTFTCEATSGGGTGSGSVTIKRDATDPTVTCTVASPGPVFTLGGSGGSVSGSLHGGTSGPASATVSGPASVTSVGNKSVSGTAADNAGNDTSWSCPYRVAYRFAFQSPSPQSSFTAGATIPVKFTLARAGGVTIADADAQALVSANRVKVGLTTATGSASYVAKSDFFQFDLKTSKNASPGQYQVVVEVFAPDGSGLVNRETVTVTLRR